jgi:hypothetical protein
MTIIRRMVRSDAMCRAFAAAYERVCEKGQVG